MAYPTPAQSVTDLLHALDPYCRVEGPSVRITDEHGFRIDGIKTLVWTATFSDDADTVAAARWIVWEASQELGARSCEHPRPVHGARPRRGARLHRAGHQPAHAGLRHGRGHVPRGAVARRRRDHLRARPQRAGIHLPAAWRVHHQRARRLHRGRLAGPVFVQGDHYQFNAKKYAADPEGDDRGACARLTRDAHRRRLRQHRHRLLDAGRPVAVRPSTTQQRDELPARRGALGAHPRGRAGRPDGLASAARSARSARRTPPRRSCAPISTATAAS